MGLRQKSPFYDIFLIFRLVFDLRHNFRSETKQLWSTRIFLSCLIIFVYTLFHLVCYIKRYKFVLIFHLHQADFICLSLNLIKGCRAWLKTNGVLLFMYVT